jgi:hypothetical protein
MFYISNHFIQLDFLSEARRQLGSIVRWLYGATAEGVRIPPLTSLTR